LPGQRRLFDLPREVARLDAASMAAPMHGAVAAGEAGLRRKSRPRTMRPVDCFDEAGRVRALAARLRGVEAGGVAIVPAASYALAGAAANRAVGPDRWVLVLAEQFPSSLYPWRRHRHGSWGPAPRASSGSHRSVAPAGWSRTAGSAAGVRRVSPGWSMPPAPGAGRFDRGEGTVVALPMVAALEGHRAARVD
jgi:hypothetical protein